MKLLKITKKQSQQEEIKVNLYGIKLHRLLDRIHRRAGEVPDTLAQNSIYQKMRLYLDGKGRYK